MYFNAIEFGKRLQESRKKKGLTQEQLANLLSLEFNTISRFERGQRNCSLDMLVEISECLSVSTDYLLKGESTSNERKAELQALIQRFAEIVSEI